MPASMALAKFEGIDSASLARGRNAPAAISRTADKRKAPTAASKPVEDAPELIISAAPGVDQASEKSESRGGNEGTEKDSRVAVQHTFQ